MYKIDEALLIVLLITLSTSLLLDDPTGAQTETLPCYVKIGERSECLVCKKPKPNQPDKTIVWTFKNDVVANGNMTFSAAYQAIATIYNEIKLVIKSSSATIAGLYYCLDYSNRQPKTIRVYNIILRTKPIIAFVNTTVVVPEGNTIALWCNATSPVPSKKYNTTWHLHSNDSDRSIGISGNKLEIQNITRNCGATYRCIVKNVEGKTHLDFTVTVHFQPSLQIMLAANAERIIRTETNQQAIELNSKIRMKCRVSSEPETTSIQWYKSDKLIGEWNKTTLIRKQDEYERYALMKESSTYPTLGLTFLSSNDDYDTFRCVASNAMGTQSEFITFVK